jgi:hypothetical protein
MAILLRTNTRNIYMRRATLLKKGMSLPDREMLVTIKPGRMRLDLNVDDGVIVIGSDAHYWPNEITTAHRGFVHIIKELKPWAVILNGDILDAATASRHDRIGWEKRPSMKEELEAVQDRCEEIEKAAGGAKLLRTHGNHDLRFDSKLAATSPEFEGVEGFSLDQQLPRWISAWSIFVNNHTIITHRLKNGIHATWTATSDAQINTVCGHLHSLRVTPRTTLSPLNGGHIYGVDTGTLADVFGPQFNYMAEGPRNWRSGFAVLTFKGGVLMPPEIAMVVEEGSLFFRGQTIELDQ